MSTPNEAFAEFTGYTVYELQQRGFRDITHPEDVKAGEVQLARVMNPDDPMKSFHITKRYITKAGSVEWAEVWVRRAGDNRAYVVVQPFDAPTTHKPPSGTEAGLTASQRWSILTDNWSSIVKIIPILLGIIAVVLAQFKDWLVAFFTK